MTSAMTATPAIVAAMAILVPLSSSIRPPRQCPPRAHSDVALGGVRYGAWPLSVERSLRMPAAQTECSGPAERQVPPPGRWRLILSGQVRGQIGRAHV